MASAKSTSMHSPLYLCPLPSADFTGRTEVIDRISERLLSGQRGQRVVVLRGRDGIGKTQCALRFAQLERESFSDILYVDASTKENTELFYQSFATSKNVGSTCEDAFSWLVSRRMNWLIVLDSVNACGLEFRTLFPSCSHGNVIVTTQRDNLPSLSGWSCSELILAKMSLDDATNLLWKTAGVTTQDLSTSQCTDGQSVIKLLHCHPAAIAQAGAYIQSQKCSFAEYLRRHCSRRDIPPGTAIHERPETDHFEKLDCSDSPIKFQQLGSAAMQLLQVLSFMHHDLISETMFEHAARGLSDYCSTLPPTDNEAQASEALQQLFAPFMSGDQIWNRQAFRGVMDELLESSLVKFDPRSNTYSVPPSYHELIREMVQDKEFTCRCAIRLLAVSINPQTSPEEQLFRQSVIPHVDRALLQGQNININDANRFALAYGDCSRWVEVELLQREVLELNKELLGENHPSTLECVQNLVKTYRRQGKEDEAELLLSLQPNRGKRKPPPAGQLKRRPRVTGRRISFGLIKITAETPLDVVVRYFTLVPKLRDFTADLESASSSSSHPVANGGLASVYQATLMDNTKIAIKSLKRRPETERSAIKHTARELNAWSKLTHPNVAECLGLAVFRDQLVMISPWMDQGNVVEFLKRRPEVDRHTLSLQLTDAVVYLHEINVVHGDLKGANVLVANDGTLKLADFGLTIVQDAILEISITNLGGGTERWMAPELFTESGERSKEADIYALGMTILEIFTGCPPFRNLQRGLAVVTAVGQGRTPERPKEISIYLRQADLFWGFLEKCWKRHPAERPTARQLGLWFREIV